MEDNLNAVIAQNAIINKKKPIIDPISQIMQAQAVNNEVKSGFKSTETSSVGLRSTVDVTEYEKYMPYGITPVGMDVSILDKTRAQNQSNMEQLGLAAANQLPNIAIGLVRDIGYVGAAITEWGDERDYDNAITRWAEDNRDKFTELFGWDAKIYAENPDKTIDANDFAWWLNQGRQLHEFASTMAIEGMGAGKVIGFGAKALGKAGTMLGRTISTTATEAALKTGSTVSKSSEIFSKALSYSNKAADLAGKTLTASYLAHNEAAMIGGDVYKSLYTQYKGKINPKTGLIYTEEELAHICSQAAVSTTMTATVIGTLLNFPGMDLYMGGKTITKGLNKAIASEVEAVGGDVLSAIKNLGVASKSIKKALNPTSKAWITLREAGAQGMEEVIQNHIQASGIRIGEEIAENKDKLNFLRPAIEIDKFAKDVWNEEGFLALVSGAFSGPIMAAQANALHLLTKTDVRDAEGNITQKRLTANQAMKLQDENIFMNTKKAILDDLIKVKDATQEAMKIANGKKGSYENAVNKVFQVHTKQSIAKGVPNVLINEYTKIAQLDNTKIGDDGKTDAMRMGFAQKPDDTVYKSEHRVKATKAIEDITYLAKEYQSLADAYGEGEDALWRVGDDIYEILSRKYLNNESLTKISNKLDVFSRENNIDSEGIDIYKNVALNDVVKNPLDILTESMIVIQNANLTGDNVTDIIEDATKLLNKEYTKLGKTTEEQKISKVELPAYKIKELDKLVKEQVTLELLDKVFTKIHIYASSNRGINEILSNKKELNDKAKTIKDKISNKEEDINKEEVVKTEQQSKNIVRDTFKKIEKKASSKKKKVVVDIKETVPETKETKEVVKAKQSSKNIGKDTFKKIEKKAVSKKKKVVVDIKETVPETKETITPIIEEPKDLATLNKELVIKEQIEAEEEVLSQEIVNFLDDILNEPTLPSISDMSPSKQMEYVQKLERLKAKLISLKPELVVPVSGEINQIQSDILTAYNLVKHITKVIPSERTVEFVEAFKTLEQIRAITKYNKNDRNTYITAIDNILSDGTISDTINNTLINSEIYFVNTSSLSKEEFTNVINDYKNTKRKVESGSRTIRRLDRGYIEDTYVGKDGDIYVKFIDTENVTEGTIADSIQVNNDITIKIDYNYTGEVTNSEGDSEYIKDSKLYKSKELADKNEEGIDIPIERLPIEIIDNNTNHRIGYVTDVEWVKRSNRNIADKTDVEEDINLLTKLRKSIVNAGGDVKSSITNKKEGILNTAVNLGDKADLGVVSKRLPNLVISLDKSNVSGKDNSILIARNGGLYSSEGVEMTDRIANSTHYRLDKMAGTPFLVVPSSNGKLLIAPLVTPNIGIKYAQTIIKLIRLRQEPNIEINKEYAEQINSIIRKDNTDKTSILSNSVSTNILRKFVYLSNFNKEILTHKSNLGKTAMFIDKYNNFIIGKTRKDGSYIIYYMNSNGTLRVDKSGLNQSVTIDKEESKNKAYSDIIDIIAESRINVDITQLNKTNVFKLPVYNSETKVFEFNGEYTYNAFLMNNLQTNLNEKKYLNPSTGIEEFSYTNQATIEYEIDSIIDKYYVPSEEENAKIIKIIDKEYEKSSNIKQSGVIVPEDKIKEIETIQYDERKAKLEAIKAKAALKNVVNSSNTKIIDDTLSAISENATIKTIEQTEDYVIKELGYFKQKEIVQSILYHARKLIRQNENNSFVLEDALSYMKDQFISFSNDIQNIKNIYSNDELLLVFEEGLHKTEDDFKVIKNISNINEMNILLNDIEVINRDYNRIAELVKTELNRMGLKLRVVKMELENEDAEGDEETEGIEGTNISTKLEFNVTSVEKDSKDTTTFKLKLLFSTLEDLDFVYDNGKRVLDEKNIPLTINKLNSFGLPSTLTFDNAWDELQNTLVHVASTDNITKFETFIETLQESNKAYMVKLAERLLIESDEVKSAFVTAMSMRQSKLETVVWRARKVTSDWKEIDVIDETTKQPTGKTRWSKVILQPQDQYYEYSMTVMDSNRNENIKLIRNSWYNNQKTDYKLNPLIEDREGNLYISAKRAEYWKEQYDNAKNNILTDQQVIQLLNEIGIVFTAKEIEILKTPKDIKNKFKSAKYKKYADMFTKKTGIFAIIIDALNAKEYTTTKVVNEDIEEDTLSFNNPLKTVNTKLLNGLARIIDETSNTYYSNSFKRGDGKSVYGISMNNYLSHSVNRFKEPNSEFVKKLASTSYAGQIENTDKYTSWYLQRVIESPSFRNSYDLEQVDSLRKNIPGMKGVMRTKMSDNELEVHMMSLFFNSLQGNSVDKIFTSKFINLVHSDKSTTPIITAEKKFFRYEDYKFKSSELKDFIWNYMILGEVRRINDFTKKKLAKDTNGNLLITKDSVGEQYYKGGQLFFLFPELNTLPEIIAMRKTDGSILETDANKSILTNIVLDHIINKVKDTKETWYNELGIYRGTKIGIDNKTNEPIIKKQIHYIDKSYLKQEILSDKTDEEKIDYAAWDFEFNYILSNINYLQLYGGDIALHTKSKKIEIFKPNDKRVGTSKDIQNIKAFLNDESNHAEVKRMIDDSWAEVTKRMAKDIAPGKDGWWMDSDERNFSKYGQIYLEDIKSERYSEYYKSLGVKGYDRSTPADAQELVTLKEHIVSMHAYSRITDEKYKTIIDKIYNAQTTNVLTLKQWINEGNTPETFDLNKLVSAELTVDEKKVILQVMKPVYVNGKVDEDRGYNKITYIKTSAIPLISGLTSGFEIDKLRKQMEFMEAMEEVKSNGVNKDFTMRASFVSGAKLGAINVANIFDILQVGENKGELVINTERLRLTKSETLSRDGFRLQQEEPYDAEHKEVLTVSQANKLLFEGILTLGEFDNFKFGGKTYNATDLKNIKENIRKQLFQEGKKTLLEQLDVEIDVDIAGDESYRFKDLSKLYEILKEEAVSRGYPINEIEALQLNEDKTKFIIPLSFSNSSSKFESLLQSLITNKITNQKLPGKSYVQASSAGFMGLEDISELVKSEIVYTNKFNGKNLRHLELWTKGTKTTPSVRVEGKKFSDMSKEELSNYIVKPAQVIVPFRYRDSDGKIIDIRTLTKIDEYGRKLLDTEKIDNELLRLIGFRIPNQGHSSMIPLEIVGFLPEQMGTIIVLPHEITNQMGSDFDVDHLYTYSANTEYINNKLTKVKYSIDKTKHDINTLFLTERTEQEKPLNKEELQNAYIDIYWSVLTNPQMFGKILSPLDKPQLATIAGEQKALESERDKSIFSPLSSRFGKKMYSINQSGKIGVAVESLASTFLSIIQDKGMYLYKQDENLNPVKNPLFVYTEQGIIELFKLGRGGYLSNEEVIENGKKQWKDIYISNADMISMWQSEAVDNAKNLNLSSLHYNNITADIVNTLSMLTTADGKTMSLKQIVYFIKQPAVVEYVKMLSTQYDTTKDYISDAERLQLESELFEKYRIKANISDEEKVEYAILSESELQNALGLYYKNPDKLTSDFYRTQYITLIMFKNVRDNIAKPIRNIQTALNFDTKGVGRDVFSSLDKSDKVWKDVINSNRIYNADLLVSNDTELGSLLRMSVNLANKLWTGSSISILPHNSSLVNETFNFILQQTTKEGEDKHLYLKDKQEIWKEMKKYFINNPQFGSIFLDSSNNIQDITKLRRSLLYDYEGNKSLATLVEEAKKEKWSKRNIFIQRLQIEQTSDLKHYKLVNYIADRGERIDEQENTLAFIELLKGDEVQQELANKLIQYAYIVGGIQDARSYLRYIPNVLLKNLGMSEYLNNIKWENREEIDINRERFIRQYYQHHPQTAVKLEDNYTQTLNTQTALSHKYRNGKIIGKPYKVVTSFTLPRTTDKRSNSLLIYDETTFDKKGYPDYLTIRDRDNNRWLLYQKVHVNEDGTYDYIALDLLGTDGLGFDEYNSGSTGMVRSLLPENRMNLTEVQLKILNESKTDATPVFKKQQVVNTSQYSETYDIYFGDADNGKYNRDNIINSLDKISNSKNRNAQIAKLLLQYGHLIPDNFNLTFGVENNRATTRFKPKSNILESVDINISQFFNQTRVKSDKVYREQQLEEVIIHELLHVILRNEIVPFLKNRNLSGLKYEFMRKLDNIRENVVNNLDKYKNVGLSNDEYNLFKLYKREGKLTQELIEKYEPFENLHEFISYTFTNRSFQEKMNSIKDDDGRNIFERISNWISEIINELMKSIGIVVEDKTVLKNTITGIINLIEEVGKDKSIKTTDSVITEKFQIVLTKKNLFTVKPNKQPDMLKAPAKASVSTKYIGFGKGSTGMYRNQIGSEFVNTGLYNSNDVVFVSINGKVTEENYQLTINEVQKALDSGATILTDNEEYTNNSTYNNGEKRLMLYLQTNNISYTEQIIDNQLIGIWNKEIESLDEKRKEVLYEKDNPLSIGEDEQLFTALGIQTIEDLQKKYKLILKDGRMRTVLQNEKGYREMTGIAKQINYSQGEFYAKVVKGISSAEEANVAIWKIEFTPMTDTQRIIFKVIPLINNITPDKINEYKNKCK